MEKTGVGPRERLRDAVRRRLAQTALRGDLRQRARPADQLARSRVKVPQAAEKQADLRGIEHRTGGVRMLRLHQLATVVIHRPGEAAHAPVVFCGQFRWLSALPLPSFLPHASQRMLEHGKLVKLTRHIIEDVVDQRLADGAIIIGQRQFHRILHLLPAHARRHELVRGEHLRQSVEHFAMFEKVGPHCRDHAHPVGALDHSG